MRRLGGVMRHLGGVLLVCLLCGGCSTVPVVGETACAGDDLYRYDERGEWVLTVDCSMVGRRCVGIVQEGTSRCE